MADADEPSLLLSAPVEGFVGVLIGGFITATVQWVVTPRVQRRIRADLRREESLLELGRLLTEEIPRVRERLRSAGHGIAFMKQGVDSGAFDKTNPKVQQFLDRDRDAIKSAAHDWRLSDDRIDWLMDRIGDHYKVVHRKYAFAAMRVPTAVSECEKLGEDELEERWQAEDDARRALVKHVESRVRSIERNRESLSMRARRLVTRKHRNRKRKAEAALSTSPEESEVEAHP